MGDGIKERFEMWNDEYLKFDLVSVKRSSRPDLHAFLLLNELVPATRDMVCAAEHDEIFLEVDADDLAKVATQEQVRELVRCGVRYCSDTGSLAMFV